MLVCEEEIMIIDPMKKYSKKDIMELLEFTPEQLAVAEQKKLIMFFEGSMYGVYFFQFLRDNSKRLEELKMSV